MPKLTMMAHVLRLVFGLAGAGALWLAARTDTPARFIGAGVLIVVIVALTQEVCAGLIDAAEAGKRLDRHIATVLVTAVGPALAAVHEGRLVLAGVTGSCVAGLIGLALSGRLFDLSYWQALETLRLMNELHDARAEMEARAAQVRGRLR